MPTPSFSARVHDAGATLRVARPAWMHSGPAGHRRLAMLVLLALAGLLAVIYLTLRLTPLSTVQRVTVVGVQGPDAPAIRRAIEQAALGQSTLGFGDAAVERAVAKTASITGVTVHTKFPHAVQVEVRQLRAVGAIDAGGRRMAVSAAGQLLPDWDVGDLPLIRGARAERSLVRGAGRSATTILGLAPAELLAHVARVDDGTTVRIADGPALLFRDTNRLNAKWAAAVAVLGDAGTRGATWIDLRVPEAPVAGKGAPPALPSRTAKVGKVAGTDDALATAGKAAAVTGDASGIPSGAATTRAAPAVAPTSGTATAVAPVTGTPAAPAATTPPAAAPNTGAAATGTGGAATSTGSPAAGSGTASTAGGAPTNSGVGSSGTAVSPASGGGVASGGGTAPTAQVAP